jgi:hypothetical protein
VRISFRGQGWLVLPVFLVSIFLTFYVLTNIFTSVRGTGEVALGGLLITIIGGGLLFLLGVALNVRKVDGRWVSSDRHEFMDMSVELSFIAPVVVGVIVELVAIGKEFGKVWGWTACFAIPIGAYVIHRYRHRAVYRARKAAKPQRKAQAANDRAKAKARREQLRATRAASESKPPSR